MTRYLSHHLDEIRSRLDIVQWIGRSLSLVKAGRHFKGLCPFHQEKTPSFTVSAERQLFHCFGCGVGGDIFTFTMKRDGLSFPEAVKHCASAAHVTLPHEKDRPSDPTVVLKKRLFRLNQLASEFFSHALTELPAEHPVHRLLKERRLSRELAARYRLGYAPAGWQGLVSFFEARKAPLQEAAELGLIREKDGRYYDFFRDRLIFPIVAVDEKILGFGARRLSEDTSPKYLNSSDSSIYHKGRALYGLNWARDEIRRLKRVFVVEGYMDFIALDQVGLPAVAPLGTALTEEQLRTLARYSPEIVLAFDNDDAGFQAFLKSAALAISNEFSPKVLILAPGEDPDSFLGKYGRDALLERAEKAPYALDVIVDRLREKPLAKALQQEAIALVLTLKNPIEQVTYLEKIAAFFGICVSDLKKGGFEKNRRTFFRNPDDKDLGGRQWDGSTGGIRAMPGIWEKRLIHALFEVRTLSPLQGEMLHSILLGNARSEEPWASAIGQRVLKTMMIFHDEKGELPTVNAVLDSEEGSHMVAWLSQIFVEENKSSALQTPAHDLDTVLKKITFHQLKNKLRGLTLSIEQAERHKNIAQMASLLEEKMKLLTTLNKMAVSAGVL